mmetsp:Transcript_15290/g.39414  ORF Transcript_15290/g.39414 Transcript_15290/m.39414 type:complete len:319 (+) Transcript_15290:313-1269(+)
MALEELDFFRLWQLVQVAHASFRRKVHEDLHLLVHQVYVLATLLGRHLFDRLPGHLHQPQQLRIMRDAARHGAGARQLATRSLVSLHGRHARLRGLLLPALHATVQLLVSWVVLAHLAQHSAAVFPLPPNDLEHVPLHFDNDCVRHLIRGHHVLHQTLVRLRQVHLRVTRIQELNDGIARNGLGHLQLDRLPILQRLQIRSHRSHAELIPRRLQCSVTGERLVNLVQRRAADVFRVPQGTPPLPLQLDELLARLLEGPGLEQRARGILHHHLGPTLEEVHHGLPRGLLSGRHGHRRPRLSPDALAHEPKRLGGRVWGA